MGSKLLETAACCHGGRMVVRGNCRCITVEVNRRLKVEYAINIREE
jgi:hypothetical protein